MAAPKSGTRERILDAAEQLFATRGFDGTSTREIVAKSGDTIGSVNYHFGSKQALLDEVIKRRWEIIAVARRDAYEAEREKHGDAPPIEAVVAALVIPYMEKAMRGGKSWRSYMQLQTRLFYSPDSYDESLRALSEPVAREYVGWMQAALPTASLENLGYAYQFMIGSTVESAAEIGIDRIHRITGGACSSKNFEAVSARLVRFIAAGIEAICLDG
jgi:AcrR family transcriptional regulator